MLEHAATPEDPAKPPTEAAPEPPYYEPPNTAESLTGQDKAPRVKRFNRKMIAILAVASIAVVALAFAMGLQAPRTKPPEPAAPAAAPPAPNARVAGMATDYSSTVPLLGEPRPGDVGVIAAGPGAGQPRQLTPLEQYQQQAALEELRNQDRARTATLAFANAGGNDASAAVPAGPDSSQLQQRLLDMADRPGGAPPAGPMPVSARDDANRQDDKREFVDRNRDSDFSLHARVEAPRSPYTLFAGTVLPCVLTQGINSDLPGPIGCMISENVYDTVTGKYLLLPQGTKVIGTYDSRIAYGQNRVLVVWTRVLRPDGSTLSLEGMPGLDLSGYAGVTGAVNNHYLRLLTGVVLGSILGASSQIAVGANSSNPNFAQLAIQGAGQNVNEAGQQITRKNLAVQPTIEVAPGGRLQIFATKDLILPPWTG